jgi:3-deoxy-alpha-D-manno-octulosonate 8-oxidase
MRAMKEFYPVEYDEFWSMAEQQGIVIPKGVCDNLTDDQYDRLFDSTIVHEKPLTNALGSDFKDILTKSKVVEIFMQM